MYSILKADVHSRKNHLDEALSLLNNLDNSDINHKQLQIKILAVDIFIKRKRYHEAEELLLKLIKNFRNSKIGYLNLSNLYFISKELNKGIRYIKKWIEYFPKSHTFLQKFGINV